MIQFYFLSIILNIAGGFLLSGEYLVRKLPVLSGFEGFIGFFEDNPGYKFIFACVCFFTGIIKFISVTFGDIPVAGDMFPALLGILIGFMLSYDFYKKKFGKESGSPLAFIDTLQSFFMKHKTVIGIAGIVVSVFHFIFPGVLFL